MEKKREIRYFAAIHFLMTGTTSFWSFATNYFRDAGLTSSQIGVMNAAGTFVAMLMLPIIGVISDRIRSPRKMFLLLVLIMLPPSLILGLCGAFGWVSYILFFLLSVLSVTTRQSANSSMDAWAGGEMSRLDVSFGSIRRFGSFGYICSAMLCSALVGPVLPSWMCFLFMIVTGLPLLLLIGSHRGDAYETPVTAEERKEKPQKQEGLLGMVFRNYYFVSYLFLAMAFDLFLGIINLDMSYLMDYIGEPMSALGFVGSFRACTEIVVMILISRQKKLPPFWILLTISGVLIALEHLLYPTASSILHMILITIFCSGLSGGFFYGIGNNYVFQVVDRRAGSTAMAVLGVAKSLAGVVGSGLGGTIIDRYGVITLTTGVGLVALALTAVFFVTCFLGRFIWKKPYVTEQS